MTGETRPLRLGDFATMRAAGDKIAMLTCYDATFATLLDRCGVDMLLVGDSLGNVVQGHESTLPVTMQAMEYHTACVARGTKRAFIVADMPFGSYQEGPAQAMRNAARLLAAGAHMVKLEGGRVMAETVRFLVDRSVPVCGHLGLTPQSVHQIGGYRVQGRDAGAAETLKADALALEEAGAVMLVLEMTPATLAAEVTRALARCATIGIGAGADCGAQVLVLHDLLGITPRKTPRFVRNFLDGAQSLEAAIKAYVAAVKDGSFPAAGESY